jgi:hypothetical protein
LIVRIHDALNHLLMRSEGAGLAQQLVNQRCLAMVNVRDDCDVTKMVGQDSSPSSPAISPSSSNTTP